MCKDIAQVIMMEGEDKDLDGIRKKKALEAKAQAEPSVIVYSTQSCPYCTLAKEYLSGKGVKYTDYDVSADMDKAREMVMKSRQRGVPVLEVNGRIIVGFNRPLIDDALSKPRPPRREALTQNIIFDPFDL